MGVLRCKRDPMPPFFDEWCSPRLWKNAPFIFPIAATAPPLHDGRCYIDAIRSEKGFCIPQTPKSPKSKSPKSMSKF